MWLVAAGLSAFFAGLTAILAKCGIKHTDSDVATAVRTLVVLFFSWVMVLVAGSAGAITEIRTRSLFFLVLSGLSTGASWICYFRALSLGNVNQVAPIDKSSTVLTVLLAVLLFQETEHLTMKLIGTIVLAVGILLMIEKKEVTGRQRRGWLLYAILSAVFASLTSILAKVGITGVESNLGTAIRTGVVLVMAWGIVFARGKASLIKEIPKSEWLYLCLSGIATGASWLLYYYAIQNGVVSVVVPMDKLSIVFTVFFSFLVFGEKLTKRSFAGLCLMVLGTLTMAVGA